MDRISDAIATNNNNNSSSKKRKLSEDGDASDAYLTRLAAFRQSDQDRNDMVQELLEKYNDMKHLYEEKAAEYDSERETRMMWQKAAKEHDSQLRQLQLANVCTAASYR